MGNLTENLNHWEQHYKAKINNLLAIKCSNDKIELLKSIAYGNIKTITIEMQDNFKINVTIEPNHKLIGEMIQNEVKILQDKLKEIKKLLPELTY